MNELCEKENAVERKKRGDISDVAYKIEALLLIAGKQQKWLNEQLGLATDSTNVANWKRDGRVPVKNIDRLCKVLDVPKIFFVEPGHILFDLYIKKKLSYGSGIYWRKLTDVYSANASVGFRVFSDAASIITPLQAITFSPISGLKTPGPITSFTTKQKIRFWLDAKEMRFPSDPNISVFSLSRIILCYLDPSGWTVLCPNVEHIGFERTSDGWLLPGPDREGLHLSKPTGTYRAVALLLSRSPESAIEEGLRNLDRAASARDALAAWILQEKVDYVLKMTEFNVLNA